jgi:hypothetical protein
MKGEERIVELLTDMVIRQDQMLVWMERQDAHQKKTNIELADLRLSVMQLADQLRTVADHERRIDALEHKVGKD